MDLDLWYRIGDTGMGPNICAAWDISEVDSLAFKLCCAGPRGFLELPQGGLWGAVLGHRHKGGISRD